MANIPGAAPYTQTTVKAPVAPSTTSRFDLEIMAPLIRELVVENPIMEPTLQADMTSARSFFTGSQVIHTDFLLSNLRYGQRVKVKIEKDQNPFDLATSKKIEYNTVDDCHDQIALECELTCLNTLPAFEEIDFAFDSIYSYGVRACDLNKDFWDFGYFTKQYAKSRKAEQFIREVDMWNKVKDAAITTPATTVDAILASKAGRETHFWENLGTVTSAGRDAITEAYWYLKNNFSDIRPIVFVSDEFAHELVRAQETQYGLNNIQQRVNTYQDWDIPGFSISSRVEEILGGQIPVRIMKRSPWMSYDQGGLNTRYPLFNVEGGELASQYVLILDPRYGYEFSKDYYHLVINPYDCDKLDRGMQDYELVGTGTTFPVWAMALEFSAPEYV